MNNDDLIVLLKDLQALPKESEWVEFKINNSNPEKIGQYISALSNSACYHQKKYAYLVFGIEDTSHRLKGTNFIPSKKKKGSQELENWIATQLNPRIDFNIYEFEYEGMKFSIFRIEPTRNTPVSFKGVAYIRIGSYTKKLDDHPEKERKIWTKANKYRYESELALKKVTDKELLGLLDYKSYLLIRYHTSNY